MKKNQTRRALMMSLLSLLLCASLLVGATYAWFTDSASTAVNTIQSGTLDVDLQDADGNSIVGQTLEFIKADGSTEVLWEPGCTYTLPAFKIVNLGNLALKYKVEISGITGDAKLLDVIDFTYTLGSSEWNYSAEGSLQAEAETELITITGHMQEEAGNEYQGLTVTGIGLTVYATQLASEFDSYGNDYDEEAEYALESPFVPVPDNATEPLSFGTKGDDGKVLDVTLPAELLNSLPASVEKIKVAHGNPQVDTRNNTMILDNAELLDQNGNIIDLEALGNTTPVQVTVYLGNSAVPGVEMEVYHDGELIATAVVSAEKTVTYEALHFCQITVSEKPVITVTFSDGFVKNFQSLKSAMRFGYSGGEQVAITVYQDIEEAMGYLEGNIVCGKEGGVTITNTIVDEWIYCGSDNFTIGEGVTYTATGYNSGLFVYGDDCVINGDVIVDCYYQRYGDTKLTVNAPGSLTVVTETFILRYTDGDAEAGIYVNGDNNDETVELNLAVAYFYQGMISAKDATLQAGVYWQTNDTDGSGSANLVLDHSKLFVTVNEHNFMATGNSTVTLKNGSVLNVAGGYQGVEPVVDETSSVMTAR